MPDERLPNRVLATSFWLAALGALICLAHGRPDAALGFAVGAAVGIFSLWSLMVVVPRALRPERVSPRLVYGMAALVKLPVYALVLSWAMTAAYIDGAAVFVGTALVPVVLVLKAAGYQLFQQHSSPAGDDACRRHQEPTNQSTPPPAFRRLN